MATVRSVRPDELDGLLALYRQLNPEDPELERDEDLREHWEAMLADEWLDILVLATDDRLVSTCVLSVTRNLTRNARPFGVIENMVTDESHRRRGFGRRLLQAAIDRADERGCYKIMLLTGTDRPWKLRFYEECGFDRAEKTGFVRYLSSVEP